VYGSWGKNLVEFLKKIYPGYLMEILWKLVTLDLYTPCYVAVREISQLNHHTVGSCIYHNTRHVLIDSLGHGLCTLVAMPRLTHSSLDGKMTINFAKADEPIEILFGQQTQHCVKLGLDPLRDGAVLRGVCRPIAGRKVSGAAG